MPSSRAKPFRISGTVTLDGSNYRGAKIWIRDVTTGGDMAPAIDGITYYSSEEDGKYHISLPDVQSTYLDQDIVIVYCKLEDGQCQKTLVTVDLYVGKATANFTFIKLSGLVDGCKSSPLSNRKGGVIKSQLNIGCEDGMG